MKNATGRMLSPGPFLVYSPGSCFSMPNLSFWGRIPWGKDSFSHTLKASTVQFKGHWSDLTLVCVKQQQAWWSGSGPPLGPAAAAQNNNTTLKRVSGKCGATNSSEVCLLACVCIIRTGDAKLPLAAGHTLAQSSNRGQVLPLALLCFISRL